MEKSHRTEKGATLLELLAAMVVVGLLGTLLVFFITTTNRVSQEVRESASQLSTAQTIDVLLARDIRTAKKITIENDGKKMTIVLHDASEAVWEMTDKGLKTNNSLFHQITDATFGKKDGLITFEIIAGEHYFYQEVAQRLR